MPSPWMVIVKIPRGWGSQNPDFLKESMKLNCNFWRGGGRIKPKTHLWEKYGYFLEKHI